MKAKESFNERLRGCCAALFCLFLILVSSFGKPTQSNTLKLSTQEEIAQDIALVPCKDNERLNAAKALFARMGDPADTRLKSRMESRILLSTKRESLPKRS